MTQRFCLPCDLDDETGAIAAYEGWHRPGRTPPAVTASIRDAGISNMESFRIGAWLVTIDAVTGFSFDREAPTEAANPAIADWEARMLAFKHSSPEARGGEKWLMMSSIFRLIDHTGGNGDLSV